METTNLTTQKEINEGNELIVNFMEIKKQVGVYYLPEFGYYKNNYGTIEYEDTFNLNELKYHTSWDWLMPVIERIKQVYCNDFTFSFSEKQNGKYRAMLYSIHTHFISEDISMIGSVYKLLIDFIKWHNK